MLIKKSPPLWIVLSILLGVIGMTSRASAQSFTQDYVSYAVISSSAKTVRVEKIKLPGSSQNDTVKIDIPASIPYGGIDYQVTEIGKSNGGQVVDWSNASHGMKEYVINIPSSITKFYKGTLNGFYGIVSFVFAPNKTQFPVGMFAGIKNIYRLVLPEGLTSVPRDFARNSGIKEVVLPSTCRSISDYAFATDGNDDFPTIDNFHFNPELETIGVKAFYHTSPIVEKRSNDESWTLILPPALKTVGESAFEGAKYLYTIELPPSLKVISKRMMADCKHLRYVNIPEGVERIEDEALADNGGEYYVFPYGYSSDGAYNFELPSTIKYVGKHAFTNPCRLISIIINTPEPPETGGKLAKSTGKVILMVPKNGFYKYSSAANWKDYSIENIKSYYSQNCQVLVHKNIKEGGTVIGGNIVKKYKYTTVEAKPANGYIFKGWIKDGVIASDKPSFTFTPMNEYHSLMAIFEPVDGGSGTKPDNPYATWYFIPGADNTRAELSDIRPRYGLENATDWTFDFENSEQPKCNVVYRHAHPDKYPDYVADDYYNTLDFTRHTNSYSLDLSLPESDDKFVMTKETAEDGSLLPSAQLIVEVPIKNKVTGEKSSMTYTVDIFMPGASKPEIIRDFYGHEALQVYDNNYFAMTSVSALDAQNGFDVEMEVYNTSTGKTLKKSAAHLAPGAKLEDIKIDQKTMGLGFSSDSRYCSASIMLDGTLEKGKNYVFRIRARNYDDNGKPQSWVEQSVGRTSINVDINQLNGNILYTSGSNRRSERQLKYADKFDNSEIVEKIKNGNGDYSQLCTYLSDSYTLDITINSYPASWGACELWIDDVNNPGEFKKAKRFSGKFPYETSIAMPGDCSTHIFKLRWPDVDFEKEYSFTDKMDMNSDKYVFCLHLTGEGIYEMDNIYMVYETISGNTKSQKFDFDKKGVDYATFWGTYYLDVKEPEGIRRVISVTDSVPEGSKHAVFIPGSLDSVKGLRNVAKNRKSIMVDVKKVGRYSNDDGKTNTINLTGLTKFYVKLVDASTGKVIRNNVSYLTGIFDESAKIESDGTFAIDFDDLKGWWISGKLVIYADNYVPAVINNVKYSRHSMSADGYKAHIDKNNKMIITLPMRKRANNKRPFDVVSLAYRLPDITDPLRYKRKYEQSEPWTYTLYSGPSTRITYEGGFRPSLTKTDGNGQTVLPTLKVTVVYYNNFSAKDSRKNGSSPWSYNLGCLSKITLKSLNKAQKTRDIPARMIYNGSEKESIPNFDALNLDYDYQWGFGKDVTSVTYKRGKSKYVFVTYEINPGNFVNPGDEDKITIALKDGSKIDLCYMKNITDNVMFMAEGIDYNAPVGEERIAEMSEKEMLGEFQKTLKNFEIELPTDKILPFNIAVEKINDDFVVKGIMSWNFLPGGTFMDMADKLDFYADVDKAFYDIQRAVTNDKQEYSRDDRVLGTSTAFLGIRGWIEGRFHKTASGRFVPQPSGIGLKTELSGFINTSIPTPLFRAGMTLSGELSTSIGLAYPMKRDLAWAVSSDDQFKLDVMQHTKVELNTSLYVQAGLDIYIARAVCGVKGSLGGSFDSEIRYKPYLKHANEIYDDSSDPNKPERKPEVYTYSGSKMTLEGSLKAYAEVKFLWWTKRISHTIFEFDKTWYDPDNESNPLYEKSDDSPIYTTVLRSSVYKPLKLNHKLSSKAFLTNVDTYAQPMYLYGGKDMVYYKLNPADITRSNIMLRSGAAFNGGNAEPILSFDATSRGDKGAVAYEVSTADASQSSDINEAPKYVDVKVALSNGSTWNTPTVLSKNDKANYAPRVAVQADGKAAVVWKGGEYVPSDIDTDQKSEIANVSGGKINGSLYLSMFDGNAWSEQLRIADTSLDHQIAEYAVAMSNDKPVVLASVASSDDELDKRFISAISLDDNKEPRMVAMTDINGTNPQLVALNNNFYGTAIDTNDEGKADLRLFKISPNGAITDLGLLGLSERCLLDYRLVAPDDAQDLSGLALVWKEVTKKHDKSGNDKMVNSIYGALIRNNVDEQGNDVAFVSCPQPLAEDSDNLDISFFDAYLHDGNQLTAAVTLYDRNTGGANVVENTATFQNTIRIEYAAIDTEVERGEDFGYYAIVFNEGYEAIDYVDMQLGKEGATHTFNTKIYPGHSAKIYDMVLYNTDLGKGIVPYITPHFTSDPLRIRTYAQAKAQSMRAPAIGKAPQSVVSTPDTPIKLQVVDMNVNLLNTFVEGSDEFYEEGTEDSGLDDTSEISAVESEDNPLRGYTSVTLTINNNSPIELNNDYTTNVGLYLDPNGIQPYEYAHTVNISAAEFNQNDGTVPVRILVGMVPDSVVVYAVAHTVDMNGNVVVDQNMQNNTTEIFLAKNDLNVIPSGVDEVLSEVEAETRIKLCNEADGVRVEGLVAGDVLRVYDITGRLYHFYQAKGEDSHFVTLPRGNAFIFSCGKWSEKLGR